MKVYETTTGTQNVLEAVRAERLAQNAKWGQQSHPPGTIIGLDEGPQARWWRAKAEVAKAKCQSNGPEADNWHDILDEEVAEAYAAETMEDLEKELIQTAAVCVAWVEHLHRQVVSKSPRNDMDDLESIRRRDYSWNEGVRHNEADARRAVADRRILLDLLAQRDQVVSSKRVSEVPRAND